MRRFFCAISLFVVISLFSGCESTPRSYVRLEGVMLGTNMLVIADLDQSDANYLSVAADSLDREMKRQMSIFDPNSMLSQINRGESDLLTDDMCYNITLADSVSRLSGGVYDITVMPLVKAWGFARKGAESTNGADVMEPNIDSLLEFVGYEKISIKDHHLVKSDPRIALDFNSIAKGYTVDKLAQIVEQLGARNYLVDIGGELHCKGVNSQGIGWRIGVERPFDGNMTNGEYLKRRLSIDTNSKLRAVATSGNYRRFYINDDGHKIAHTIDPRTGRSSISTLLSATVMARNCALADSYATMFMALGSGAAEELAREIDDIEVYFIYGDSGKRDSTSYREYISSGLEEMLME